MGIAIEFSQAQAPLPESSFLEDAQIQSRPRLEMQDGRPMTSELAEQLRSLGLDDLIPEEMDENSPSALD